jgi:hypothetical protein
MMTLRVKQKQRIKPKTNVLSVASPPVLKLLEDKTNYGFLNKRVRYAIESATARYPIIAIKLAIVEAMKG